MLRKILFLLFIIVTSSEAAVKNTESVLKSFTVYQLGESEFVVRLSLSGTKIPPPEVQTMDESLTITVKSATIKKPEELLKMIESIPLIHGIRAENNSDGAKITMDTSLPMKVHSIQKARNGYSIRIKSDVPSDIINEKKVPLSKPKDTLSPQNSLPFSVNSKITIDIRDAELRDVIRGLMSYIGRNVIIDSSFPDVLVTMTLEDVRVDEIVNYLMRTYEFACYRSGVNTLTFGKADGLYKLSGANEIKPFRLYFADINRVNSILKTMAGLDDSAVMTDERTKTLYVKTNPAKMAEVEELVTLLDSPQKQVMIHATIFEFNDSDTLVVQNALDIAYDDIQLSLGGLGGLSVNYRSDRTVIGERNEWTSRVITDTFNALQNKIKGKVLANPSVIATDGKQAEITLTQDYPYVSDRDDSKGTVTWSTEEVGPKLTFTPRIGRDGYVTLTLDISTGDVIDTQISSTGEQMPVTTTRSVKTEVRVRDGMPFVIGGLFREDNAKMVSKIPVLGDIPLLGELFTYRHNTAVKTQVVMVIIPYILDAD